MADGNANAFSFGGWRHRAAHFYMLIIVFAFPLFSVPCPKGTCSSPVEVVAVHMITKGFNNHIVRAILYPSALFSKLEAIVADNEQINLPDWNSVGTDLLRQVKENKENSVAFGLCLIIGSYLSIAGAISCILGPTYFSAFGPLIILWSVYNDKGSAEHAYVLPMFSIAVFCSLAGTFLLGGRSIQQTSNSVTEKDASSGEECSATSQSQKKEK